MKKTLILISACLVNGFLYADFEESVLFFREVYDDSYQEVVGAEVCGCDSESPAVFGVLTIPQTVVYEYEDLFEDENGDWRWCTKSKVLPVVGIDSLSWCPATTIVLPDTIRRIASCAFYCCENLTSVNIPPGVTEIGSGAFWGCRSIVSIELPSTVKCIYDSAFSYCENLQIVTLKGKLDYLGCWAFYGCFSLQHIRIDGGIVEISYNAFTSCHELQEAPISDITEIIGEYAFSGCSSLKTVTIPDRVKTLEQYVFTDCSGLVSAKVDVGWVSRGTFAGCSNLEEVVLSSSCTNIGYGAFVNCSRLSQIAFPTALKHIGREAFYGCDQLTHVELPPSITYLEFAFYGCSLTSLVAKAECLKLWGETGRVNVDQLVVSGKNFIFDEYSCPLADRVVIMGSNIVIKEQRKGLEYVHSLEVIGQSILFEDGAFCGISQDLTNLVVRAEDIKIGTAAFRSFPNLDCGAIIGNNVYIGDYAFDQSFSRKLPEFSEGLRYIGKYAFDSRTSNDWGPAWPARPLVLPKSVEYIGDCAFRYANISDLTILGDARIGKCAFLGCTNLMSVELLGNVVFEKTGGCYVFSHCDNLERVVLNFEDTSQLSPEDYVFYGCTNIKEVVVRDCGQLRLLERESIIPSQYEEFFGVGAYDPMKLRSVTLENYIQEFDGAMLGELTNVQHVAFSAGVSSIASNCFSRCHNLETIDFGRSETLTAIGADAFRGLSRLKNVQLPCSLRTIGDNAFRDCVGLTAVNIPIGVSEVGRGAFYGCSEIRSAALPAPFIKIGDVAFNSCVNLEEVVFGGNAIVGDGAFKSCAALKALDLTTVSTVMEKSFAECTALTTLKLPADIDVFGSGAFEKCTGIEELTIEHRDAYGVGITNLFGTAGIDRLIMPRKIESGFFPLGMSTERLEELVVTEGTLAGSARLFTPPSAKKVVFPASLVDAKDLAVGGPQYTVAEANPMYMHDYNHSLRSKGGSKMLGWSNHSRWWYGGMPGEIGFFLDYVREIGDKAFQNCDKLEYLCFDWNVTNIGKGAFKGLTSLKSVSFGEKVVQIDDSAFEDCVNLESVNAFPASLKKLGKRSFANCKKADHFYFWGKPPSTSGTNGLQNAFVDASPNTRGTGWYTYKNYTAWTNKVGKLGQWQGLDMFCTATNRVEYHFNWLLPQTKTSYDSMMADLENCSNVVSCELSPDVSNEALIAAELLGVSPTITVEGNTAYFNVDSSFRVEEFAIDSENKSATLTISIETENGIIDPSFTMVGIPDVQVAEDLNGEWRDLNLKDSFIVNRVSEKRVLLSTTVDLSSYRFFRAKVK